MKTIEMRFSCYYLELYSSVSIRSDGFMGSLTVLNIVKYSNLPLQKLLKLKHYPQSCTTTDPVFEYDMKRLKHEHSKYSRLYKSFRKL
jgi:hypothetical protein